MFGKTKLEGNISEKCVQWTTLYTPVEPILTNIEVWYKGKNVTWELHWNSSKLFVNHLSYHNNHLSYHTTIPHDYSTESWSSSISLRPKALLFHGVCTITKEIPNLYTKKKKKKEREHSKFQIDLQNRTNTLKINLYFESFPNQLDSITILSRFQRKEINIFFFLSFPNQFDSTVVPNKSKCLLWY